MKMFRLSLFLLCVIVLVGCTPTPIKEGGMSCTEWRWEGLCIGESKMVDGSKLTRITDEVIRLDDERIGLFCLITRVIRNRPESQCYEYASENRQ